MADIATRSFFCCEVAVVLRDRGLVHGRTKIGRVGEVLGKCVIDQEAQAARIPPAHVYIACVIPTLCCVLQQINGAYGERLALHDDIRTARCQNGTGDEGQCLERTPWSKRTWTRSRIVDQVRPLQMKTSRAQIPDFDGCICSEAFLYRTVPLLNVLCRRVRIEGGEAYGGSRQRAGAQHRSTKIQSREEECSRRREVVGLLGFGKDVWHVVTLVAPGVQIDRRIEDAVGTAQDEPTAGKVLGNADAGSKIVLARIRQPFRVTQLPSDEHGWNPVLENQIGVRTPEVIKRICVFIAEAQI